MSALTIIWIAVNVVGLYEIFVLSMALNESFKGHWTELSRGDNWRRRSISYWLSERRR